MLAFDGTSYIHHEAHRAAADTAMLITRYGDEFDMTWNAETPGKVGQEYKCAFQDADLFPPLVIRMLRIGENTGALDTALLNVAYFYNREVRESIGKLQAMIEPTLTLVLGAILGWVMLAVLGPVYDTISTMKF